jgi:hypothetical protein
MAFFDDFSAALRDYPTTEATVSFVNVSGPGPHVDVNEVWSFQVRVTNNGRLNMTNVFLSINCHEGVLVGVSLASMHSSIFQGPLTVNGNGGSTDTTTLLFRVPPSLPGGPLLSVNISSWDADLSHLLITETGNVPFFLHFNKF